jgi:hypothetical protein
MMVTGPRPQFPWYPEIYDTAEDIHQLKSDFSAGRTLVNSDAVVMKRCDEHDIAANDGKLGMHAKKIARFAFVLSPEIPLIDDDGIRAPIMERRPSPLHWNAINLTRKELGYNRDGRGEIIRCNAGHRKF